MPSILRNPHVRALAIAETVTGIGSWITFLAVAATVVFQGSGGVKHTSAIFLAGLGSMLVASPIAGVIADRYDRKRIMITAQLASAVVVSLLIASGGVGWTIYPLIAIGAAISTLVMPARQAALPGLVGTDHLTEANAFLAQLTSIVRIAASLVAAAVLAVLTPTQAMGLDVISYLAAATILLRLPPLPPPAAARESTPGFLGEVLEVDVRRDATSVAKALRHTPELAVLFLAGYVAIAVIMGFQVLSTVFTRDVLGGDETLWGLLVGLVGVGMFAAATWVARSAGRRHPWQDARRGLVLMALLPLSVAVAEQMHDQLSAQWLVGLGALVGGWGNGLMSVQVPTLIQLLAPARVLGKVLGSFQATVVAGQLTAMLALPFIVPAHLSVGGYAALAAAQLAVIWVGVTVTLAVLKRRPAAARQVEGTTPHL